VGLARHAGAISRDVALRIGTMLEVSEGVGQALGQCDEHWNGRASVLGLKGETITVQARLFRLAQDIDVFHTAGGVNAALTVAKARSGSYYDPALVDLFVSRAHELDERLAVASLWDAVEAAEPQPAKLLEWAEFDELARKIVSVIDMRSAYTLGHSPAVAALAEAGAIGFGLSAADTRTLRSAGLMHDLGRAGIPVELWDKRDALTGQERSTIERHPSLTELVLARSSELGTLGVIAGLHHERLDGSGYRGITAASLPVTARLLAAADAYQTKLERRPYRRPLTADQAAEAVRAQAASGALDPDAVAAVLGVAGHAEPQAPAVRPAGLTEREVEVLGLLVQGLSNREMAERLVLSPKTVGRHVESIYAKINVSTRVGATLFAVEHRLAATLPQPARG
jgi:HD-GYP domain-containing protein (c-di-GMP phosphodiesterase class II)